MGDGVVSQLCTQNQTFTLAPAAPKLDRRRAHHMTSTSEHQLLAPVRSFLVLVAIGAGCDSVVRRRLDGSGVTLQDRDSLQLQGRVRSQLRTGHRWCHLGLRPVRRSRAQRTRSEPSAGWTGGQIGGHPLQLVGIGCANDAGSNRAQGDAAADGAARCRHHRRPLSGDESVAVANYAKLHRTKTFVNGTAGAWDTTARVKAPNFFASTVTASSGTPVSAISPRSSGGGGLRSSWTTTASATRLAQG